MSVNTIQTAAVIQSELDKAAVEQATSGWMEVNSSLVKYNGGSEVKIPKLSMDGLADYERVCSRRSKLRIPDQNNDPGQRTFLQL